MSVPYGAGLDRPIQPSTFRAVCGTGFTTAERGFHPRVHGRTTRPSKRRAASTQSRANARLPGKVRWRGVLRYGAQCLTSKPRRNQMTKIDHNTSVTLTLNFTDVIDLRCALADAVLAHSAHGHNALADEARRASDTFHALTDDVVTTWRNQAFNEINGVLDRDFDEPSAEEITAYGRHIATALGVVVGAFMLLTGGMAHAQDKPFVPYSEALATCSAEWKQSDERAKLAKGQKQDAWQTFRAECVTRQGYVKGAKAPK
jgi:hypothetical protein